MLPAEPMDADDVSTPDRFQKQVQFMDEHPDIVLAGSYAKIMNSSTVMRQPTRPESIATNLLFHTSLIHPTAIFRRSFLEQHHLRYDPEFRQTQDYELFTRIARLGKVANIPRVLLHYRQHDKQASSEKIANQMNYASTIMRREFETLGMNITEAELELAVAVKRYRLKEIPDALLKLNVFLSKIEMTNQKTHRYDATALRRTLGEVWLESSISLSRSGVGIRNVFLRGIPRAWIVPTLRNAVRILRLLVRPAHVM